MNWENCAKALKKGISISKKMTTEFIEYSQEQQASAQRRLNDARSRAGRLSDDELERKVMKAYKEEGKRDLQTCAMVEEYMKRRNGEK